MDLDFLTASRVLSPGYLLVVLQKQIASTAVDVGKNAAKEVGKKAFDVGKNAVVDAGKKMIQKGVTKILTPKSQTILHKHVGVPMQQSSPDAVAKQAQSILSN